MISPRLFFFCALIPLGASASDCAHPMPYRIEGKIREICVSPAVHAWVSGGPRSGALALLDKAGSVAEGREKWAVPNPGAALCRTLGGQVVLGTNERGSQNSFCEASDGSLVDLSSLHRASVRTRKESTGSQARHGADNAGSARSAAPDKSVPKNR